MFVEEGQSQKGASYEILTDGLKLDIQLQYKELYIS